MAISNGVTIVGAGPAGIKVLEKADGPTEETRAVFYMPISMFEFERAGILQDVTTAALQPDSACFRNAVDGKPLFSMPGRGMIALTLNKIAAIIQSHLSQYDEVDILYSHEVTALGQGDSSAWVKVKTAEGEKRIESQFLVGCDGGKSLVRRSLFGEQSMPGFTWEKNLLALDLIYDLDSNLPEAANSNLFLHPENAGLAFRPGQEPNLWRLICRFEGSPEGRELDKALSKLLPGNPSPEKYEVKRPRTYQIHQRIVDNMRVGRVILASDAAHLCCPYGALGLNGGIADVGSLRDCLVAIHEEKANDSILDIYSEVRRDKWKNIIDPMSQSTLRMVFSDPAKITDSPAYKMSQLMRADPEAARARAPNPLALRYDFTSQFN
ncbi:hypothetical protein NLG97_g3459 [Lecanicillium saksenae]|uniref:Uncharacterized protein n=1 Tax=Lecanicillium saksenae TaxID=468837 RepID=A0ACC1QY14_9HYPO|nr:hypothetical protein NLG97_g3459 [Lecanicillium saksenae]